MKENILIAMTILFIGLAVVIWMGLVSRNDEARSKIEYCFDSQGNHYVAPDINCTH